MAYYCRVERDSVCRYSRATTFVITFPRIVLVEVVTHRVNSDSWGDEVVVCERTTTPDISKNSASSRAISFEKMLARVQADPFMPLWTMNQKGMQGMAAGEEVSKDADAVWRRALTQMTTAAQDLHILGIHKQDCNRLLEPWAWVTQVVTSSQWDNFFALRCHKAAHPAFQRIARMMFLERRKSTPVRLKEYQWHLPFIPMSEQMNFLWEPAFLNDPKHLPGLIQKSVARCAWVSYANHDQDASDESHFRTYERLIADVPVHASPAEHQLTPVCGHQPAVVSGNVIGWTQARKLLPYEAVWEYQPSDEEVASWNL